jgi:3,4-dihydroxy 2-butanone 4-phosphate synthase / GTP cyclohydrolase II
MNSVKTSLKKARLQDYISSAAEIIEEARAGRIFILVDDEDRENEGDLVIPAQFATPDAINFMIKHARGLVCLAMTKSRRDSLGLPLMTQANGTRHETAFTISIEAKEGVTTGISAADRARTVAVAINPELGRHDIVSPGHIFPLMARDGGTLVRAGHTEAAVDIARLAGLIPAGVICEIINDDGTMARLPDLVTFAQLHNLKLGTIADLIAYRRRNEQLVKRVEQGSVTAPSGANWNLIAFESKVDQLEHLALAKGDISGSEPVLVRVHGMDLISDVLGDEHFTALRGAMAQIEQAGRGVVVVLCERRRGTMSAGIRALVDGNGTALALRDYGIGAQILVDLGVKDMILLSNHKRDIVGLEGYGLHVVEHRDIHEIREGK